MLIYAFSAFLHY